MSTRPRIALVTGGARRVGRAIVERLDADGFCVAFTYYQSEREAKRLARSLTNRSLAISADLTRPVEACRAIVGAVSSAFRGLDVLVNNASIYLPGDEKLSEMMAIHVQAPRMLCEAFEKDLRRAKGRVVNMVDLLAERPWVKYSAYCASKAALWNQTIRLARELAPEVTVNGIAPGVVAWPEDFPKAERETYLKRVPLGRAGTPEDVASLASFLVHEGSYITGQVIRLDGGRSIS